MRPRTITTDSPARISWAVEQLSIKPSERILEIGCGTGHALTRVGERLITGQIVGIDKSALQVRRAGERNDRLIRRGRVQVSHVALDDAPDVLGRKRPFDKVFAINVNAFWTCPAPALNAVEMLLAPRGRLSLFYEPPFPSRVQALRRELPRILEAHGFATVDVRLAPGPAPRIISVIGKRRPERFRSL